jgi:hypothetical protein
MVVMYLRPAPLAVSLLAATIGAAEFISFPPFTIHSGKTDSNGSSTSNATLCVDGEEPCFSILTGHSQSPPVEYFFGANPTAERIPLPSGGSLVLFTGTYSTGGSGTLTAVDLLEYEASGRISNLLPEVRHTEQGERQIWNVPEISLMPILVTADANWDPSAGETHFSPHLFTVWAYVFDPATQKYVNRIQYATARKYPSLDDADSIQVLDPERATIIQKLAAPRSKATPRR